MLHGDDDTTATDSGRLAERCRCARLRV